MFDPVTSGARRPIRTDGVLHRPGTVGCSRRTGALRVGEVCGLWDGCGEAGLAPVHTSGTWRPRGGKFGTFAGLKLTRVRRLDDFRAAVMDMAA